MLSKEFIIEINIIRPAGAHAMHYNYAGAYYSVSRSDTSYIARDGACSESRKNKIFLLK